MKLYYLKLFIMLNFAKTKSLAILLAGVLLVSGCSEKELKPSGLQDNIPLHTSSASDASPKPLVKNDETDTHLNAEDIARYLNTVVQDARQKKSDKKIAENRQFDKSLRHFSYLRNIRTHDPDTYAEVIDFIEKNSNGYDGYPPNKLPEFLQFFDKILMSKILRASDKNILDFHELIIEQAHLYAEISPKLCLSYIGVIKPTSDQIKQAHISVPADFMRNREVTLNRLITSIYIDNIDREANSSKVFRGQYITRKKLENSYSAQELGILKIKPPPKNEEDLSCRMHLAANDAILSLPRDIRIELLRHLFAQFIEKKL